MYSANLHDQLINAAFPLKPLTVWAGGACTVTVAVPPAQSLAGIAVDSVTVSLALPGGSVVSQTAAPVDGSPNWAATFAADNFAMSGFVSEGFTVNLVGKDENGTARVWIVSKGDLEVKSGDASPSSTGSYVVVKLRDSAPAAPTKGDAYVSGGKLYLYDGTAWTEIGGSSVVIDETLTIHGAAADAKAVGDMLRGGFTEWEFSDGGTHAISGPVETLDGWCYVLDGTDYASPFSTEAAALSATTVLFSEVYATRHAFPPTKTSQLTNDGAPNGGGNAYVMTNDPRLADARTPTAHHATHAANGSDPLAPADIGAANASDLPYRLVEPGKWEFSDGQAHTVLGPFPTSAETWVYTLQDRLESSTEYNTEDDALAALSVSFPTVNITATRPSLPGHLCDRAGNRVEVSGATTLTLPAAVAGYARDFLVRLEISGSTVPTITFAAPTGETITYETDGDDFPVPDEAGTWLYSFTESCVAHKFAVSLKKVNEVAQA